MGFVFGSQVSLYYKHETWGYKGEEDVVKRVGQRGVSQSTQWRYPSDGVENFTLTQSNNAEVIHTMSQASAQGTVEGLRDNTMSFDYYLQRHGAQYSLDSFYTSLEYHAQHRNSEGTMDTLTFAVCPTSTTTILCVGGVIENFSLSAAAGERIKCSISMKFSTVTTSPSDNVGNWDGAAPIDLDTTWETMNDAALTRTSWFDNGVANLSFTIENGAELLHKIGSINPAGCYEGKQNVSGSCDVFLNSTGTYEWEQIYDATSGTLVFSSGNGAIGTDMSMVWLFRDVIFTEIPITSSTDTTALQSGLSWIAGSVEFAAFA